MSILNDHSILYPQPVPVPSVGESYIDPTFGTEITRLTPGNNWFDYAQMTWFNSTNEYALIQRAFAGWQIIRISDGADVASISGTEVRWSRLHPYRVYFHNKSGKQIFYRDIPTGSPVLIADYGVVGPGKSIVAQSFIDFGGGQSDVSDNDRTVVNVDNRYVVVVDLETGTDFGVGDVSPPGESDYDAVTLDMDGETYVVGYNVSGENLRYHGMEQWNKDGTFMVQLILSYAQHLGMARETDGTPVVVFPTSNSPYQPARPNFDWNGIMKVSLDGTATRTLLLGLIEVGGSNYASEHFAGRSGDGHIYIATYRWPNPPSQSDWSAYEDEIFRIKLVPGQDHREADVERLAHQRRTGSQYYEAGMLTVSMDGTLVGFNSTFGTGNGLSNVSAYYFPVEPGSVEPPPPPTPESEITREEFDALVAQVGGIQNQVDSIDNLLSQVQSAWVGV